jgi:hypothetical protein
MNVYLLVKNPHHIKKLTKDIPLIKQLPLAVLHFMNQGYHILPLYLCRNRQTLKEVFSTQSFLIALFFFSFYILLTPHHVVRENYDMHKKPFVLAAFVLFVFVWMCTLLKNIL